MEEENKINSNQTYVGVPICWDGNMLHVTFVMDCHDREIISLIASDNGSQYTAHATMSFLVSLGFEVCHTPAYSPIRRSVHVKVL